MNLPDQIERSLIRALAYRAVRVVPWWLAAGILGALWVVGHGGWWH